jgi:hypothetical protein
MSIARLKSEVKMKWKPLEALKRIVVNLFNKNNEYCTVKI